MFREICIGRTDGCATLFNISIFAENKKKRRKTSSSKASYAKSLHRRKKQSEEFGVTNLKYFGSETVKLRAAKSEKKNVRL